MLESIVKDGDIIVFGFTPPESILNDLLTCCRDRHLTIFSIRLTYSNATISLNQLAEAGFTVLTSTVSADIIQAINLERIIYLPIHFSRIQQTLIDWGRSRRLVSIFMVSPPNGSGKLSLGIDTSYGKLMVGSSTISIGVVNPAMPFTTGDSVLGKDEFSHLCSSDETLPLIRKTAPTENEIAVGKNVATLVEDGATIEVGVGGIGEAICRNLEGKSSLGVHTGFFSDGLRKLVENGIADNMKKTIYKNASVACICIGSDIGFYKWLDENQKVSMMDFSVSHNPTIIAKNPKMTAINSAFSVDLFGQIYSDFVAGKQTSQVGGAMDFSVGSRMSKGGKSIVALESTTKDAKTSRIVAKMEGMPVTLTRADVDYVVTEYGIADLRSGSKSERAKRLIDIAHPDHRNDLRSVASRLNLI
jgi:4-hydroxybutyrate CoA-transferase